MRKIFKIILPCFVGVILLSANLQEQKTSATSDRDSEYPFRYILYGKQNVSVIYHTDISAKAGCPLTSTGLTPPRDDYRKTTIASCAIKSPGSIMFGSCGYRGSTSADVIASFIRIHNSGGTIKGNLFSSNQVEGFMELSGGGLFGDITAPKISIRAPLKHSGRQIRKKYEISTDEYPEKRYDVNWKASKGTIFCLTFQHRTLKSNKEHIFDAITLDTNSALTIEGPTTIYVKGDLTIRQNATLKITKGPVDIIVSGKVSIEQSAKVNPDTCAHNLAIIKIKSNIDDKPILSKKSNSNLLDDERSTPFIKDLSECFLPIIEKNAKNSKGLQILKNYIESSARRAGVVEFELVPRISNGDISINNADVVRACIYAPESSVILQNEPRKSIPVRRTYFEGSIIAKIVQTVGSYSIKPSLVIVYPSCLKFRKLGISSPDKKGIPTLGAKRKVIKDIFYPFQSNHAIYAEKAIFIRGNSNVDYKFTKDEGMVIPYEKAREDEEIRRLTAKTEVLLNPRIKSEGNVTLSGSGFSGKIACDIEANKISIFGTADKKAQRGKLTGKLYSKTSVDIHFGVDIADNINSPQVTLEKNPLKSILSIISPLQGQDRFLEQELVGFPWAKIIHTPEHKGKIFKTFNPTTLELVPPWQFLSPELPETEEITRIKKDESYTLQGKETYVFNELILEENSTLNIDCQSGAPRVFVIGQLKIEKSANLRISNSSVPNRSNSKICVDIYVSGCLTIEKDAKINSEACPCQLIIIIDKLPKLTISSGVRMNAGIYAPESIIDVCEDVHLQGGIIANSVNLLGNLNNKSPLDITYFSCLKERGIVVTNK